VPSNSLRWVFSPGTLEERNGFSPIFYIGGDLSFVRVSPPFERRL